MKCFKLTSCRIALVPQLTKIAFLYLFLWLASTSRAENIITSGTTLKCLAGTSIVSTESLTIKSGATLDNAGTLILKKNLVNENGSANSIGTGTVIFSGTVAQELNGPNVVQNLTIDNASGITNSGENRVNGVLTLTSGLMVLGANNLTLGTGASIAGTPSATAMIVPTGTGEVRKEYSAIGSFTFPVGDNTATAEYSPLTLNFTAGAFGAGAYAGVNLVNAPFSDPHITTSFLNRYWNVTQSGITGFACDALFQYLPADVVGNESDIYCILILPLPITTWNVANTNLHQLSATGLTSFGTFTGALSADKFLAVKVLLEGPYAGAGLMSTTLNSGALIPLTSPYGGGENVGSIPNADIADWVKVELRVADAPANATSATILYGWPRAFFLTSGGQIVALDGTSLPGIGNPSVGTGNYLFVIVRHRNHLDVMSNFGLNLTSSIYSYDFTTAITQAYGGAAGYKELRLSPGVFGMVAGDADQDESIGANDFTEWSKYIGLGTYLPTDIDMNAGVGANDFTEWSRVIGLDNTMPAKSPTQLSYKSQVPK